MPKIKAVGVISEFCLHVYNLQSSFTPSHSFSGGFALFPNLGSDVKKSPQQHILDHIQHDTFSLHT